MLPADTYHILIHGLVTDGDWCFVNFSTLPGGERERIRLFDNQVTQLIIATMHQKLPRNLKGGQARVRITLHPTFGNRMSHIEPLHPDQLVKVESDVELERPVQYCEFGDL
jgi:hypothetical protein